jgi:hypothetical protein
MQLTKEGRAVQQGEDSREVSATDLQHCDWCCASSLTMLKCGKCRLVYYCSIAPVSCQPVGSHAHMPVQTEIARAATWLAILAPAAERANFADGSEPSAGAPARIPTAGLPFAGSSQIRNPRLSPTPPDRFIPRVSAKPQHPSRVFKTPATSSPRVANVIQTSAALDSARILRTFLSRLHWAPLPKPHPAARLTSRKGTVELGSKLDQKLFVQIVRTNSVWELHVQGSRAVFTCIVGSLVLEIA